MHTRKRIFLWPFRVIEVAIKSGKEEVGEKVLWHGGGLGLLEAWAKELGNNLYKTEKGGVWVGLSKNMVIFSGGAHEEFSVHSNTCLRMWINQWHKWRRNVVVSGWIVAPIEIFGYLLPHFPTTHIAHACVYIRHVMTLCKQTVSGTVTRGHK